MKNHIGLKQEKEFISICHREKLYYGGDQAWFATGIRRSSACGTVAAANIIAYEGLYKLCGRYTAAKSHVIAKSKFLDLMNQVYLYINPLRVPFLSEDTPPYRGFGWSAGVWPLGRLIRGLARYGRARKLVVKAVAYKRGRARPEDFIKVALKKDCPVALLIGTALHLKDITVTYPDGSAFEQLDFSKHWVIVTAMEQRDEGIYVKVSTWGGYAWLPLKACFQTGVIKSGMCFFKFRKL